jgi:hypothetical protein
MHYAVQTWIPFVRSLWEWANMCPFAAVDDNLAMDIVSLLFAVG